MNKEAVVRWKIKASTNGSIHRIEDPNQRVKHCKKYHGGLANPWQQTCSFTSNRSYFKPRVQKINPPYLINGFAERSALIENDRLTPERTAQTALRKALFRLSLFNEEGPAGCQRQMSFTIENPIPRFKWPTA